MLIWFSYFIDKFVDRILSWSLPWSLNHSLAFYWTNLSWRRTSLLIYTFILNIADHFLQVEVHMLGLHGVQGVLQLVPRWVLNKVHCGLSGAQGGHYWVPPTSNIKTVVHFWPTYRLNIGNILSDPESYIKVLIYGQIRIIKISKKPFRWDSMEHRVDVIESPGTPLSPL